MKYLEIALLLTGIALLFVGYRKNGRNLLLAGAIVLFLSVAAPEFVRGYIDGFTDGSASAA